MRDTTASRYGRLYVKPFKVKPGEWYMVSTIYRPPTRGSVGGGIVWAKRFKTRQEVRVAIRTFYATGREP